MIILIFFTLIIYKCSTAHISLSWTYDFTHPYNKDVIGFKAYYVRDAEGTARTHSDCKECYNGTDANEGISPITLTSDTCVEWEDNPAYHKCNLSITGLKLNGRYCFGLTAFDSKYESVLSNEVCKVVNDSDSDDIHFGSGPAIAAAIGAGAIAAIVIVSIIVCVCCIAFGGVGTAAATNQKFRQSFKDIPLRLMKRPTKALPKKAIYEDDDEGSFV